MGGGLVFKIIRIDVVLPHRVIFEFIPHQDSAEVWMGIESNAEKVKYFAFLEFGGTPNGGQRGQVHIVRSVASAESQDDRAMLELHGVKMVDDFQVPRAASLNGFFNLALDAFN